MRKVDWLAPRLGTSKETNFPASQTIIRTTTKPAHCLASLSASMASFPILAETTVKEGWKAGWVLLNHQLALILPDPIVSHLKLKISLTYLHYGKHIVKRKRK